MRGLLPRSAACIMILTVIMVSITIWGIVPSPTNHFMGGDTIRLLHAHITDAGPDGFHLNATMELGNTGPFAASLDAFTATLEYEGTDMGTMPFPAVKIKGSAPAAISVSAPAKVPIRQPCPSQ